MAKGKDAVSSAIYLRLSRDRDGGALGIDRQEAICRRLVEDRGWQVGEISVDRDLSAYTKKRRPAFEAMLDDIRVGLRDAIAVVDQDRLARRMSELTAPLDEFDALKVAIVMASGDLDTSTADRRLRAQILGSVAEHESKRKSERIRRQRDQAAHPGVPHGGQRPFGYEPDGMTLRAEEAEAIRDAAERALRGESLSSICCSWSTAVSPPRVDASGRRTFCAACSSGLEWLRCGRCGSRMTAATRSGGRAATSAPPGRETRRARPASSVP
jgi:site-specific DNA recombinase